MISSILTIIGAVKGSAIAGTAIGITTKVAPMLPWFKRVRALRTAQQLFRHRHGRKPSFEEAETAARSVNGE